MDTAGSSSVQDFEYVHSREYVEANGLGGFASSTFSGAHSRKYHGLLVAALNPPVDRYVVVSKIDETLMIGGEYYHLGCNQFPGTLYPFGVQYLAAFSHDIFPEWIYEVKGVRIRKTIAAVHGENTTLVLYEVLEAPEKFELELQPFYNFRDFHHLSHQNEYIGTPYMFDRGTFQTMNYRGSPEFFISVPKSAFREERVWYKNFEYRNEMERGMDFREDLYSHGKFTVTARKGTRVGVIVTLGDPAGRDAFRLYREERRRREHLMKPFNHIPPLQRLAVAADQFIVRRGELNTIVAGYPWFADWGRDTMIALPGLCLVTGRIQDAKKILQKFSEYVSDGMIPNRFPDHGQSPEYNTIDASLWFFNAVYLYLRYSGDKAFIKSLMPLLKGMIDWHYRGTRYGIVVDEADGLLRGGNRAVQLTWMDAKVGDWVVTPRAGKPVEINALWYNALRIMESLLHDLNQRRDAGEFGKRADKVAASFIATFLNPDTGGLYDVIEEGGASAEIRPNQLYALSLPFPVLDRSYAHGVIEQARSELLTPRGLRSLAPSSPNYRANYTGDVWSRDGAYHQGTVWSHLIGPYVDALFYAYGEAAREEAVQLLEAVFTHLDEAGVGTISEIFDGNSPFVPRGCFSQAWSVAEVLRVAHEHNLFPKPAPRVATADETSELHRQQTE